MRLSQRRLMLVCVYVMCVKRAKGMKKRERKYIALYVFVWRGKFDYFNWIYKSSETPERKREGERERDHEGQRAMHFGFITVRIFMALCFYKKSNGMLVRQLELTKIPKTERLKTRDVVLCRL